MIPLLVVLALKFQLPQPFHRPESCHRFRPTVKCRRRLPTAPEVLRQVPIRRFPATTVADSACAWVAKRKRWPPLDHQVTSQPKSVKVRVVTCHLNRSKWWHLLHNPLMFPVPVRAVAIRPCRPKKPNSKTGNAERTTIRWKLQLKARRRKLPDGPRPPRWPWAKAWLVPWHTWLAVRHHKVMLTLILSNSETRRLTNSQVQQIQAAVRNKTKPSTDESATSWVCRTFIFLCFSLFIYFTCDQINFLIMIDDPIPPQTL